jgi:hypothetical protein
VQSWADAGDSPRQAPPVTGRAAPPASSVVAHVAIINVPTAHPIKRLR